MGSPVAETLFVVPDPTRAAVWTGTGITTDAVAVAGGRIVALGNEARQRRGSRTEVVELHDATLLPGFRDGHLHPLNGGAETLDCDLVDSVDVDEVVRRLAAFVAAHPDREATPWVLGWGYPPEILPGGVGRVEVLDAVVGDRPAALWSSDHHMVWVNRRALEVAGITAATPDPPRGTIVRDRDGHPVGTLLEAAEHLLDAHVPLRGVDKEARGLEVGLQRMASAGLVFGQDAWCVPAMYAAFRQVAGAGRLTADLDLACKVEADGWSAQVAVFADLRREAGRDQARRRRDGVPGGRLTATTVKFFVDGVIEGGTAALLDPYLPLPGTAGHGGGQGCGAGHDHGIANWDLAELADAATAMDAAGFQLHLHAIGDAGIRLALDAIEQVARRNGPRDRRPVIAHTHLVHPDDLPRFRALGAVANFEPLWAQDNEIMRELTVPRLGAERSRWQYPIGSLIRDGAAVSFGSDWPVSSHEPLDGIAVAVTRRAPGRPDVPAFLPDQRIDLDAALRAYTLGTAHQAGDEAQAGTIAVGRRADLALTSQDVLRVPARELGDVEVAGTWLAGRRVHRSSD
ncbi:amidohydrolase [Egicoccus halophilus]|uniref:Amidohydrolase n=1 Tax=Egicoccus halophilus TaxID=1670830 RepID=A0A8J3A889_9ACTN|nr:amidohydrolase [Egicoccus halophilus]GGI04176.1 amidohydrolase [Egicoccus halophilus]